ncbi:MAG TPA: hypothetical protein VKV24_20030 [Casimicrobiaceae bacterium]|nr:hypothetical protein [Casimicrobiaceae bacterium]
MSEPEKTEASGVSAPNASGSGPRETDRRANDTAKPFTVYCIKFDGQRYLFQRYATRSEAEEVARTLRSVGGQATAEAEP